MISGNGSVLFFKRDNDPFKIGSEERKNCAKRYRTKKRISGKGLKKTENLWYVYM
jgi:hypothetical protein